MNRRDFLVLCVAACSSPPKPRTSAKPTPDPKPTRVIADDWTHARSSQLAPSPIAAVDASIVVATTSELEFLDPATLARVDYIGEQYSSMCVMPDNTLVGWGKHPQGPCELDIIRGRHIVRSLPAPDCVPGEGVRLLAAGVSAFYRVRDRKSLDLYRIEGRGLVAGDSIDLGDHARRGIDQALALSDGRVVVPIGRSLVIYEHSSATSHRAPARVAHLAPAWSGRVWISTWNDSDRIDRIALVRLAEGLPAEANISMEPARITHMAANARGELAILTEHAGSWAIVVLDANGHESRRIPIEDDIIKTVGLELALSFVALTTKRVVLLTSAGVYGWDAANGTRVK